MTDVDHSMMGKRLNKMIEWDYETKLEWSLETIEEALKKNKKPVISSSFGKDSVVLTKLIHSIDDSVKVVTNDTGVMYPETMQYMRKMRGKWNLDLDLVYPEETFFQIVRREGYPKTSRNSKSGDIRQPACCKILKEDPMKDYIKENKVDMDFVGLIGDEGRQRRWAYIRTGSAIYEHKTWNTNKCIPLICWTEDDVWKYHKENDIPKNPCYQKYCINRTGCVTCTGHKNWKKHMAKYSTRLLKYILNDMGGQTNFDDLPKKTEVKV